MNNMFLDRGHPAAVVRMVNSSDETRESVDDGRPPVDLSRQVRCDPRADALASVVAPSCAVEMRRAFRLGPEYEPGINLIAPARLNIEAGTAREIPIAPDKITR
jgi:hypothetical protein